MEKTTEKVWAKRKPAGFREGFDGELACNHRDVSTCDACAAKYSNIIESYGVHYWMRNEAELNEWNVMIAEIVAEYA